MQVAVLGRGPAPRLGTGCERVKPKIHPPYYRTTVTCACGAVYHVGSTRENIRVEICANCHPFYTGQRKIVDTGGRVERFIKKYKYRPK